MSSITESSSYKKNVINFITNVHILYDTLNNSSQAPSMSFFR